MTLKLGKLPAKVDSRTIPLKAVLKLELLPELPAFFDVDESLGGVQDDFMFNNSIYGDCVIAARAHQTLRFERFEQSLQIPISDQEVVDQYFKESHGRDQGLVLLDSLKSWRKEGWPVGGRNYSIYAFASVDWKDHVEVKHCIHLLGGVNFGMMVFSEDMRQFENGEGWHLTPNNGYFQGGHGVYACKYRDVGETIALTQYLDNLRIVSYAQDGLWLMTWGRKQFATWDFWDARVDEAYAIVDDRNKWQSDSPLDVERLDQYLQEITGDPSNDSGCLFPPMGRLINKCKGKD